MEQSCHDILYSNENQQTTLTHNMGESYKHNVERKMPKIVHDILFHLYKAYKQAKLTYGARCEESSESGERGKESAWERA